MFGYKSSLVLLLASFAWDLPKGFPTPPVPADNPMTAEKVELGRYLFYDKRMSVNGTQSCASCHKQELAFTDGRPVGVGATGEKHPRGPMSLVNIAYAKILTWRDPAMTSLEHQALVPMLGEHPVELGVKPVEFISVVRADPKYRGLFAQAFPGQPDPYNIPNVTKAIACFERSIISARSPYDRYHYSGDDNAVSDSAKRGEVLFFSQPLSCFRCHGGFDFSGGDEMHNNGLKDADKFKAPTLRNIALTAPYMHDGSLPTLDAVLDHYSAGGSTGHDNPLKDPLIGGFKLSAQDKQDLIAFLNTLTDQALLHDARFADPW